MTGGRLCDIDREWIAKGDTLVTRRLPVYIVIDCSHSMRGKPIEMVQAGIQKMIQDLSADPMAIETVWLSIITFATGAEQLVPLTEVLDFRPPELVAKGRTHMGAGLRLLKECIDREVRKSSKTQKGDWKPVAFLLSDGGSGDAWITPAKEIRARHDESSMVMIAVGFGGRVHVDKLRRVTSQVLVSETNEPESFAEFLEWASQSVNNSVQTVAVNSDVLADSPPPRGFYLDPKVWGE